MSSGYAINGTLRARPRPRRRSEVDSSAEDAILAKLEPVRDLASRFGGSHAQRDVLTLTLIEAASRGGQPALARHYIAERLIAKPSSGWGRRLLTRTQRERHATV